MITTTLIDTLLMYLKDILTKKVQYPSEKQKKAFASLKRELNRVVIPSNDYFGYLDRLLEYDWDNETKINSIFKWSLVYLLEKDPKGDLLFTLLTDVPGKMKKLYFDSAVASIEKKVKQTKLKPLMNDTARRNFVLGMLRRSYFAIKNERKK